MSLPHITIAGRRTAADAVKLQTYRPDTITLDCDNEEFRIKGGLWDGRTLYEFYEEANMPWERYQPLFEHARKLGITIFSSPFDTTAVDLLEDLGAPAYKIASFEAVDLALIEFVAKTGKPMIIPTGMADAEDINYVARHWLSTNAQSNFIKSSDLSMKALWSIKTLMVSSIMQSGALGSLHRSGKSIIKRR